jgi:hypothetical protein
MRRESEQFNSTLQNFYHEFSERCETLLKIYNELKDHLEDTRCEIAQLRARVALYEVTNFIPNEIGKQESDKVIKFCP